MVKAVKECNATYDIKVNIADVCGNSGLAAEMVPLMPSLSIKTTKVLGGLSSLMTSIWKKIGYDLSLLRTNFSSDESQNKGDDCQTKSSFIK
jgi:hypothetical protein